jgi:hypothetical protein
MQDHVTPSGILLLAGPAVLALLLIVLSLSLFRAKAHAGWRCVTPGVGYWTAAVLCLALAGGIGWVWGFVGSTREDAHFQMRIAWWLSILFGLGAVFAGWRIFSLHRLDLRWRGETLRWSGSGDVPMRSLESLRGNLFGFAQARFQGKNALAIDLAAVQADQLIEKLEDVNGLAQEERPPEH